MKIVKLILVIATITLISCKVDSTKATLSMDKANKESIKANKESNKAKKDEFTENPIAGVSVPNDNYLLQHNEVNFFSFYLSKIISFFLYQSLFNTVKFPYSLKLLNFNLNFFEEFLIENNIGIQKTNYDEHNSQIYSW